MTPSKPSTAYKRAKVVKQIKLFHRLMTEAQTAWEDYELRKRTAVGDDSIRYYAEMSNLYHGKHGAFRAVVSSMMFEFGITEEEISGEGEDE